MVAMCDYLILFVAQAAQAMTLSVKDLEEAITPREAAQNTVMIRNAFQHRGDDANCVCLVSDNTHRFAIVYSNC